LRLFNSFLFPNSLALRCFCLSPGQFGSLGSRPFRLFMFNSSLFCGFSNETFPFLLNPQTFGFDALKNFLKKYYIGSRSKGTKN
jgi:hypothetical protein